VLLAREYRLRTAEAPITFVLREEGQSKIVFWSKPAAFNLRLPASHLFCGDRKWRAALLLQRKICVAAMPLKIDCTAMAASSTPNTRTITFRAVSPIR